MKYHATTSEDAVMVQPQTVDEAGLFQWLAERFKGQSVTLQFDTTNYDGCPHTPMLWIKPTGETLGGSDV